jgi:hypothetical protein
MEMCNIYKPTGPKDSNLIFNTDIPPIRRLSIMSDTEFEEIVLEWAYSYLLQNKYVSVKRMGGAGDKGRDIIGYCYNGDIDVYQCKQYKSQLMPGDYWVEFGKLCYYTYNSDYKVPKNYYIVASQGIGPTLTDMIDNPKKINKMLIKYWDSNCKNKITKKKLIELDNEFEKYINEFDFSIVKELTPIRLIDEYSKTKWFKYRFGGGLPKRPKVVKPQEKVEENEKKMIYIRQLIEVYKEKTIGKVSNMEDLKGNKSISEHFYRQRVVFHSAQALKRFTRDELIDEDPYEEIKEQIYQSVIDKSLEKYESSFERLNMTLDLAKIIPLEVQPLGLIQPVDKCGVCHELVNEKKLIWVAIDES